MTPRTTIPAEITQAADNASSAAKRAAVALNRSATAEGMKLAERDMSNAINSLYVALQKLEPFLRTGATA